jgi:hypothetical protein
VTIQAPFYLGKFPEAAASFSVINASIVGGVGATSALLGGRLADRLAAKSDTPDAVRMLVRATPSQPIPYVSCRLEALYVKTASDERSVFTLKRCERPEPTDNPPTRSTDEAILTASEVHRSPAGAGGRLTAVGAAAGCGAGGGHAARLSGVSIGGVPDGGVLAGPHGGGHLRGASLAVHARHGAGANNHIKLTERCGHGVEDKAAEEA